MRVGFSKLTMPAVPEGPRGRLRNTVAMLREPFAATERWRQAYGSTYRANLLTGRFVATGDPELVQQLFRMPPLTFGVHGEEVLEPMVGERSIFSLHTDAHSAERKLLMPPFHGRRMTAYGTIISEATQRAASKLTPGSQTNLMSVARTITSEVIVRAVFGVSESGRVQRHLRAIEAWINSWKPALILVPALRWNLGKRSPWGKFLAAREELSTVLLHEIAERRASGQRGEDILSLLLEARYDDGSALSDHAIRDELRALLFAGHETTMISIAWAFAFLHDDQEALERTTAAAAACSTPDELAKDPWIRAVVKESMRVYPVIPAIFRRLRTAIELGPYALEAGETVCVSAIMLHTHPELFPEPERFSPERFLTRKYKPWEYIPFGGGHRRCIGAAMAEYEAAIVVGTLLQQHRFQAVQKRPAPVRRNISMAPDGGVPLRVV